LVWRFIRWGGNSFKSMKYKVSEYLRAIPDNCFLLFYKLEQFFNAAEIQVQRIQRVKKSMFRRIKRKLYGVNRGQNVKLFSDIHFYFICLGQISKLLEQIDKQLKNKSIEELKQKFGEEFKSEIRNNLEHIDERAVGKRFGNPHADAAKWKRDFGNLDGDNFTFGGEKYEISKEKLKSLWKVYDELISIIHHEYGLKNPNFVKELEMMQRSKKLSKFFKGGSF